MRKALLVVAAAAAFAAACGRSTTPPAIERLRIGMIAPASLALGGTVSPDSVNAHFAAFTSYLKETLDLPVTLEATRDLAALTASFQSDRYDIAFLGAVDFVRARERHRAVPLVTRQVDRNATVVFLASAA